MTHAKKTTCMQSSADTKARMVLIVDSDELHRTYHTMVLQRFEYCVRAAAKAEEALQMIDDAVPALVITELDLPGMSGLDLLARIQQDPRTARIPVVALAANRDHATEIRCLRAGFSAYLGTPAGVEDLYRTIQTATEPVRRSSPRVHAKIPILVNNVPLDCVEGECASVISEHGMYIRTLKPHPPNSRVDVRIDLEGRTIAAGAVVLYSHRSGEGPFGEPGMGIKFAEIAPQDQEFLRRYINNELAPH
jgi:two-component system, cell cycle response regulator DivK